MMSIFSALLGFLTRLWATLRRSQGERLGRAEERLAVERQRAQEATEAADVERSVGGILVALERDRSEKETVLREGEDLFR